ncbi:hypothetical protein [Dyella acidisoli]|nr:hypothetical protein [Dyella acidisoli]
MIAIVAVVAACYYLLKPRLMSDKGFLEIAQAPIWSDLQGIEFQHRAKRDLKLPVLLKGAVDSGKYDVLGVVGKSSRTPSVWIVLNVNAGVNGIYAMPSDVDYALPCSYLRDLTSKEVIDSKVRVALQSHCIESL